MTLRPASRLARPAAAARAIASAGRFGDQFDGIERDAVEAVGQRMPDLSFGRRRTAARDHGDPVGSARRRKVWSALTVPFDAHSASSAYSIPDEPATNEPPGLRTRHISLPASACVSGCRHRKARCRCPRRASDRTASERDADCNVARSTSPDVSSVCRDRWISRSDSSIGVTGWRLITGWRSMRIDLAAIGREEMAEGGVALELRRADDQRHAAPARTPRGRSRWRGRYCRSSGWNRRSSRPCSGRCAAFERLQPREGIAADARPSIPASRCGWCRQGRWRGNRRTCAARPPIRHAREQHGLARHASASASMTSVEPVRSSP